MSERSTVLVIAGNFREAAYWSRHELGVPPNVESDPRVVYVSDAQRLRGWDLRGDDAPRVVFVGTCHARSDFAYIIDMLRARGWQPADTPAETETRP